MSFQKFCAVFAHVLCTFTQISYKVSTESLRVPKAFDRFYTSRYKINAGLDRFRTGSYKLQFWIFAGFMQVLYRFYTGFKQT